jgi:flavin reductase (DIM6/NTAB) family NADH-FMN oxidoreductase RutF/DNA-binding IclR family transcriptional regulator
MATFDQRELRDVLGAFVTGVTIITTVDADGKPRGVTANSFSSVSLDPPLVLWSQATTSQSFPVFRDAKRFVVNILSEEQVELSRRFATSKIVDKFEGVSHRKGMGGIPILDGSSAFLECRSFATYPGGDHVVYLGEVENFERSARKPLAFHGGRYMVAYAHEPGAISPEAGAENLAQLKAARLAIACLPELRARLGMHMFIGVWGNRGPTVAHWEPMPGPITENVRLGTVLSTLDTATGLVFSAFLPREQTRALIDEERSAALAAGLTAPRQEEIEARIAETRVRGLGRQSSIERPDFGDSDRLTLSAPVFDHTGRLVLALSAFGSAPEGRTDWDAPVFGQLAAAAAELSRQLGHKA